MLIHDQEPPITGTAPTDQLGTVPWEDVLSFLTDEVLVPRLKESLAPAGQGGVDIASTSMVWALHYKPVEEQQGCDPCQEQPAPERSKLDKQQPESGSSVRDEEQPKSELTVDQLFADVTGILRDCLVNEHEVPREQAECISIGQIAFRPILEWKKRKKPHYCWILCPNGTSVHTCVNC